MSIFARALESVGRDVLIFRDKVLVAEGRSVIARGDDYIGVQIVSGELHEKLKETKMAEMWKRLAFSPTDVDGTKHIYIDFMPYSGLWIDRIRNPKETPSDIEMNDEIEELFKDCIAVDKFNFRYGMVSNVFKDYPGYRGAID